MNILRIIYMYNRCGCHLHNRMNPCCATVLVYFFFFCLCFNLMICREWNQLEMHSFGQELLMASSKHNSKWSSLMVEQSWDLMCLSTAWKCRSIFPFFGETALAWWGKRTSKITLCWGEGECPSLTPCMEIIGSLWPLIILILLIKLKVDQTILEANMATH